MTVILPNTSKADTDPNLFSDTYENDVALKVGIETETSERKAEIAAQIKPVTWYTPKVIATSQSTSSTSFVALATPDEIAGIVVPANGVIRVGYVARWSSTVGAAGRAVLCLNGSAIKSVVNTSGSFYEVASVSNETRALFTSPVTAGPLNTGSVEPPSSTSGLVTPTVDIPIETAGTYTVSVLFRATSGAVSADLRRLWVEVHGV